MREDSQDVKEMYDKFMGSPGEGTTPGESYGKGKMYNGS